MPPFRYKIRKKRPPITAEELFAMEPRLDARWYELEQGNLLLREPAGCIHGDVAGELYIRLKIYVQTHSLGKVMPLETGFTIARNPDTVLGPDLAFIRKDRIPETGLPIGFFDGAPDLAVEVMSPSDTFPKVDQKLEQYIKAGTRLVWGIQPRNQTAWVRRTDGSGMRLSADDMLNGEDIVPGFRCRLGDVFGG